MTPGSIPSPSSGEISLGPLDLRAYGLMIALGVVAAVWLSTRRWVQRVGERGEADISAIALWAVPAGVIGARIYHVITDWQRFDDEPLRALRIWEGGLGIWGGIALGVVVGGFVARKRGLAILPLLDAVAPALPLAQAIGRWGNWFNQELFGRPLSSDVPWALEIDPEQRPDGFEATETFHPTFLYESLWNLALCLGLIWLGRRFAGRLRPGQLFALYVAGYTLVRFFIEGLRIDPANQVGGLRVNEVVSAVVFALAVAAFTWLGRRPAGDAREEREPEPVTEGSTDG